MQILGNRWLMAFCGLLSLVIAGHADTLTRKQQIEADWLVQEEERRPITTRDDALGAVDGVKNGSWAFHTSMDNPSWWQVDLGRQYPLARTLIYNRCDGAAGRTARLIVLLSDDGKAWRQVYQHDGTTFYGATDGKPLAVNLGGARARFLRLQQPGQDFLHLDEVEVYGSDAPQKNLALWANADQSSTSMWSVQHVRPGAASGPAYNIDQVLARGRKLTADLRAAGVNTAECKAELAAVSEAAGGELSLEKRGELWRRARWAIRKLEFANPLLDFDKLLFVKRVPSSFSHMSDQYYGWWSRPGGGIFVLEGLKGDAPRERCLTESFAPGSFVDPEVSYDARKILFAYCKYYPNVSGLPDKQNKENVPEDAFYHIYEMNADGTGLRQLTRGRYDDFDARYLPSGEIVFLSTRRGQFIQTGRASAEATLKATLPDSYVRCGGDAYRPVSVYTLHTMNQEGGDLRAISPFESFEWTPSIMRDGRIMYARWDYVDRNNMPYMKLWSVNPDGTNPKALYGNFTTNPHCIFEARCVPNSDKILFTASGHHAITGGSLVLLDPQRAIDGDEAMTRLTPEVCFPETEGWPMTHYLTPLPLSESYYLTAWSNLPIVSQGGAAGVNGAGLYLCDRFGNLEMISRDPAISSVSPIPLRPRVKPPVIATTVDLDRNDGSFVLLNVYDGLPAAMRGLVKSLRIVGVPPKTQPVMNSPNLGITQDDPGKYVLGTVPVEADGSANFRAPAGTSVFFQALDAEGYAIQTMRTLTCVQPGETLSCVGCHEPRNTGPRNMRPQAIRRAASKITLGPDGSWPLRYDTLVQPVLNRQCASCHRPDGPDKRAASFDLSAAASYANMIAWGKPSLIDHIRQRYAEGRSLAGASAARQSPLLAMLRSEKGHYGVRLEGDDLNRLVTWMDTYGQRQGSFSPDQEDRLRQLRLDIANLLQP